MRRQLAVFLSFFITLALAGCASRQLAPAHPGAEADSTPSAGIVHKPGHVFIVMLENEGFDTSFGADSPAPYLARTLPAQGALLANYYGIGHNSLGNYIALIGGQAPSPQMQADCSHFTDWMGSSSLDSNGQVTGEGCVLPPSALTIANQMQAASLTWRAYMEDMGNDIARDSASVCAHPVLNVRDVTQKAAPNDKYAVRHNPFMYYHSVIDDAAGCAQHVVNLKEIDQDLASVATTSNYTFITPNLCSDGHDATCVDGTAGGLVRVNVFLQMLVPKILKSPAFQKDGLLIITFDEASVIDRDACCNEQPGPNSSRPGILGPGGGRVGAVLISPFIKPGTVSNVPYNHYSLLRSIEDMFGLSHLGFAGAPGLQALGGDVFNR